MNYFSDWKKQAAMTATSDADVEKAFADMASGFVENKLPSLMQGDHNIGFEVVKKNDDNTCMLGIFAFKINKSLLFAPVFFIHGEIKGPMLYRCDTHSFVPATKEWASYLLSALEKSDGVSSPKSRRQAMNPLVQMDRIRMVSGGREKSASAEVHSMVVPVRCHKGGPIRIPNGNCVVVIDEHSEKLTPVTWNDRLPGGKSILKMAAADDGTIRCSMDGVEDFWLAKKDADLFRKTAFYDGVAIEGPDEIFFEMDSVTKNKVATEFFSKHASPEIDVWDEFTKSMDWMLRSDNTIRDFLAEPNIGAAATDAVVKAASTSYDFAEMLAHIYGSPEGFIPQHHTTELSKEASDRLMNEVGFINDIEEFTKAGSVVPDDYYKDGFFLYDGRPEYEKSLVISEFPKELSVISEPGVYTVAQNDGTLIDNVLALTPVDESVFGSNDSEPRSNVVRSWRNGGYYSDGQLEAPLMLLIKDGKILAARDAIGIRTGDVEDYDDLTQDVSSMNMYVMVHNGDGCGPIAVFGKNTKDGVEYIETDIDSYYDVFKSGRSFHAHFHKFSTTDFTINKDLEQSSFGENVLGNDVYWVKLKYTTDNYADGKSFWGQGGGAKFEAIHDVGGPKSLDNFIFGNWKTPKVKVIRHHSNDIGSTVYQVEAFDELGPKLSKKAMLMKMAADMGIDGNQAYSLLDEANNNGSVSFYLKPHEKIASRLRLVEAPMFQDEFDDDHGVAVQPVQSFNLSMHGDQEHEDPSAVGDMWNPTSLTGLPDATVLSTDPADLRALADTYKLPNVFEHGVIGTLANAFNAISLVDKYVAKLEDGVDALGRLKFLLHWAPGDFMKAYGEEAMTNLEAQVSENFNSLGDLLLDLLKKTERQRKGESSQFEKESE